MPIIHWPHNTSITSSIAKDAKRSKVLQKEECFTRLCSTGALMIGRVNEDWSLAGRRGAGVQLPGAARPFPRCAAVHTLPGAAAAVIAHKQCCPHLYEASRHGPPVSRRLESLQELLASSHSIPRAALSQYNENDYRGCYRSQ